MNLALIVVAALVAEPADSVQVFSWETASQVIWLEERRPDPKAKPPKPFEWKGFFKIRSNGQLPVNGVFQVDGWPVQPEVEWVSRGLRYRRNAPPVVVGPNSGGQFDLLVREPGRYTFKASVGKVWSSQVTIEAKTFPFELGMRQPDFLEKYGNPDATLPNGRWIYKRWPSLVVYHDRKAGMQAETMHAEEWMAGLMESTTSANTIVLHARSAHVVGSQTAYSEDIESTHDWYSAQEYLEWTLDLASGTYRVSVEYSSMSHGARSLFGATLVHSKSGHTVATISSTLEPTNSWEHFVVRPMGDLVVPDANSYILRLHVIRRIDNHPKTGLLNVRGVRLAPLLP